MNYSCNDFEKNMLKFLLFIVVAYLIMRIFFPALYLNLYSMINLTDSSIYARYATNEMYDENVFFNEDVEDKTEILAQLEKAIPEISTITRIQDFANIIVKNEIDAKNIFYNNERYQEYLVSIESSVDDLMVWCEKVSLLDYNLAMASLYLTFLIIACIMVIPFGFRKTFYILAGVTYIIASLSFFSDGISDYLVAQLISLLAKISSGVFTYGDMNELKTHFLQTFKEGTLTFIIFDTVIQILQNSHSSKIEKSILYLQQSIEIQLIYLSQFQEENYKYIAKFKVPVHEVLKICKKNIQRIENVKRKKISNIEKNRLEEQRNNNSQLIELLKTICFNEQNENTTKEYINCLKNIRWLMYKCNII